MKPTILTAAALLTSLPTTRASASSNSHQPSTADPTFWNNAPQCLIDGCSYLTSPSTSKCLTGPNTTLDAACFCAREASLDCFPWHRAPACGPAAFSRSQAWFREKCPARPTASLARTMHFRGMPRCAWGCLEAAWNSTGVPFGLRAGFCGAETEGGGRVEARVGWKEVVTGCLLREPCRGRLKTNKGVERWPAFWSSVCEYGDVPQYDEMDSETVKVEYAASCFAPFGLGITDDVEPGGWGVWGRRCLGKMGLVGMVVAYNLVYVVMGYMVGLPWFRELVRTLRRKKRKNKGKYRAIDEDGDGEEQNGFVHEAMQLSSSSSKPRKATLPSGLPLPSSAFHDSYDSDSGSDSDSDGEIDWRNISIDGTHQAFLPGTAFDTLLLHLLSNLLISFLQDSQTTTSTWGMFLFLLSLPTPWFLSPLLYRLRGERYRHPATWDILVGSTVYLANLTFHARYLHLYFEGESSTMLCANLPTADWAPYRRWKGLDGHAEAFVAAHVSLMVLYTLGLVNLVLLCMREFLGRRFAAWNVLVMGAVWMLQWVVLVDMLREEMLGKVLCVVDGGVSLGLMVLGAVGARIIHALRDN